MSMTASGRESLTIESSTKGNVEFGTARMGSDPRTSVLNAHNQSWDVKNLFVTDGACFTSGGFQNPALTMMAITVRACEYIVEQVKRREL
jgi:choline dehydrogenase-like flavoprotein